MAANVLRPALHASGCRRRSLPVDPKEAHPIMSRTPLWLFAALSAAACSTTPPATPAPVAAAAPARAPAAAPAAAPVAQARNVVQVQASSPRELFDRERGDLDQRSVFFGFDAYAVPAGQGPAIEAHAGLAEQFPTDRLALQGNCDERGSREYNLALGDRRANAVKERLVELGVAPAHIVTVSYGKEKPRATCHEESCWSQNRRVDFVDEWR
jgi:peptidoglycan-associated lipoprotein